VHTCTDFMGNPEGNRQLGRPRGMLEDNIKMVFKNWGGGRDWIDLAQDRDRRRAFMNALENLCVS